jgi:hypothetical protein
VIDSSSGAGFSHQEGLTPGFGLIIVGAGVEGGMLQRMWFRGMDGRSDRR